VSRLIAGPVNVDNSKPDGWVKVGIMVRDSADPGAAMAGVLLSSENGITFHFRGSHKAGANLEGSDKVAAPVWLKLTRKGKQFTAFYAKTPNPPKSEEWKRIGEPKELAIGPGARAGFAATSHNNERLSWIAFKNTSFTPAP
jgi:hypothetical protein